MGINVTSPSTALAVSGTVTVTTGNVSISSGQVYSASYNASAGTTLDFNLGNIIYTSAAAGTITLNNMKDGASYSVVATTNVSGQFTFQATGLSFYYVPGNGNTVVTGSAKATVYTFLRAGSNVFVSWITGF